MIIFRHKFLVDMSQQPSDKSEQNVVFSRPWWLSQSPDLAPDVGISEYGIDMKSELSKHVHEMESKLKALIDHLDVIVDDSKENEVGDRGIGELHDDFTKVCCDFEDFARNAMKICKVASAIKEFTNLPNYDIDISSNQSKFDQCIARIETDMDYVSKFRENLRLIGKRRK
ncbi:hypothetical protein ACOME3_007866 [Neoechinorhynchus agilis]